MTEALAIIITCPACHNSVRIPVATDGNQGTRHTCGCGQGFRAYTPPPRKEPRNANRDKLD